MTIEDFSENQDSLVLIEIKKIIQKGIDLLEAF